MKCDLCDISTKPPHCKVPGCPIDGRSVMANNRMYIRHKPSGSEFNLAKYYPSTGWYTYENMDAGLDQWLQSFKNVPGVSNGYGQDFDLTYEVAPRSMQDRADDILKNLPPDYDTPFMQKLGKHGG